MHGSMAPATTNITSSANEVFNLERVNNDIVVLCINIYRESGVLAEISNVQLSVPQLESLEQLNSSTLRCSISVIGMNECMVKDNSGHRCTNYVHALIAYSLVE